MMSFRVGCGYDVHQLADGRPLVLGGVRIPFHKGLAGHSDADVLCHAIADALLGAAGLGDIGRHFPDTDLDFEGISSLLLLERVAEQLKQKHVGVVNVDATIVAQEPKLSLHIPGMIRNIARHLNIGQQAVSIKATTTEGLGFAGKGEGMAAQAVALVRIRQEGTARR